jgi:hypothetical protein
MIKETHSRDPAHQRSEGRIVDPARGQRDDVDIEREFTRNRMDK